MKLRLHFVVDPTGWLCIGLVFGIWLYNTFFIPTLVLLPHYNQGHIPWAAVVCYYVASALCMAALFRASTADPGRLPVDPHIPHSEREHWELCNKCNLMRPKRSHHCSRCGHCVRRMDHHCPWINNCVGEDNHWLFLQLCFYAQVLSLYTLVLDFCQYYYFQPLTGLDQRTTVRAIIHQWRKHGTVVNIPRSGRPTKITPRAQRRLIQEVTKDPTTTSKELQASLASVKKKNIIPTVKCGGGSVMVWACMLLQDLEDWL
ncbi:palmitoyltransferase ZDHHC21 isoform X2 [Scophthalmus maximus]|uniref:palmitoyltransferase ZDHHC21 isoform X2 n=1 Tax=Scophthalmus maximus TaxID=52904 RepID=UPI001FA8F888|nr:palmitoyltransferase ZDHHC21 isoform X2 [Scophthalmus maximus]